MSNSFTSEPIEMSTKHENIYIADISERKMARREKKTWLVCWFGEKTKVPMFNATTGLRRVGMYFKNEFRDSWNRKLPLTTRRNRIYPVIFERTKHPSPYNCVRTTRKVEGEGFVVSTFRSSAIEDRKQ